MKYTEMKSGCLFHASSNTNLQKIHPYPSGAYEGQSLVFASRLPNIAATFLHDIGKGITCNIESIVSNVPILHEKYVGAFETKYRNEPGAIYIVPAANFSWAPESQPGKQRWNEDYVSAVSISPIEKIYIPNVRSYILDLIDKGMIVFKKHDKGMTLEQRLAEIFSPGSISYQNNYEFLSNPDRIKAEINARQQIR
ncbi:hypothetical protein ABHN11_13210 [Brevibacillus centrosporus]|jgi:hypothetical protein|uniref:hypothetical protein n=1 Tax=Brevibacillus centrosporus TaxID=54910 RepID=UPI0039878469